MKITKQNRTLIFLYLLMGFTVSAQAGLISHWTLDDARGTVAINSANGEDNGAVTNGPSWSNGQVNVGLLFDGTDDRIVISDDSKWDVAGKNRTFAIWFKADSTQTATWGARFLDHFQGGTPGDGWYFGLNSNQKVTFEHRASVGSHLVIASSATYNDNQWHHAAITLDAVSKTAMLYIDGVVENTKTFDNLNDNTGNKNLTIGGKSSGTSFHGNLDDIRIYDAVLTGASISSLYNDVAVQTVHAHMNDADPKASPAAEPGMHQALQNIETMEFPRPIISMADNWGEMFTYANQSPPKSSQNISDLMSKYTIVGVKGRRLDDAMRAQVLNPDMIVLREISPRAYQGYQWSNENNQTASMSFFTTGPITDRVGQMFAGHWLYKAGTTTTHVLNAQAGSLTVTVADASKITTGQYAVIYNAGTNFENAEHVKVVSKSGSTLTFDGNAGGSGKRNYKSSRLWHASGSIIATHTLGQGNNAKLWSYNHALTCPRDDGGLGKTLSERLAEWMTDANLRRKKYPSGGLSTVRMDGVLFDADIYNIGGAVDVDNNMTNDKGFVNGQNVWGQGLEVFYDLVRVTLPNKLIVGGYWETRGNGGGLNGIEMETFPVAVDMEGGGNPSSSDYDRLDSQFSLYQYSVHNFGIGPSYTSCLTKVETELYPQPGSWPAPGAYVFPTNNSGFRFSFGLSLMCNGFYGRKQKVGMYRSDGTLMPDAWYDEYAVDVINSGTMGNAIPSNPANESGAITHSKWMGKALGSFRRIYNSTKFDPVDSMIGTGSFDESSGWKVGWSKTSNLSWVRDTDPAHVYSGSGAMKIAGTTGGIPYHLNYSGCQVSSDTVTMTNGKTYTVSFMAKADVERSVRLTVPGYSNFKQQPILLTTNYRRYVLVFIPTSTKTNRKIDFYFGRDSAGATVWLDDFYIFEGSGQENPNLFRRDFENAVVIANARPASATVALRGNFMRINGAQDSLNDGSTFAYGDTVSIDPYDAAILVRLDPTEGAPPPANNPPVLNFISNVNVNEGGSGTVNISATDADLDPIIFSVSGVPAFGSFVDNGDGSGSISLNPGYVDSGSYVITVTASDGQDTDSQSFTVTVNNVNRAPDLNAITNISVDEGASATVNLSASDPDGNPITLTVSGLPAFGNLTDNGDGTGTINLTPGFSDSGSYAVTVTASDGLGGSDSESFTVTVNNVNQPPNLNPIADVTMDENASHVVNLIANDPDGDLIFCTVPGCPAFGIPVDNGDGTGTITFNPTYSDDGVYTMTVIFDDSNGGVDSESFTLTVNNVNRAPSIAGIGSQSVDEGSTITVSISSSDPDDDSLALSSPGLPLFGSLQDNGDGTGSITFSPQEEDAGSYGITVSCSDGTASDSTSFTLVVNILINLPPVLDPVADASVDEGGSATVIISATDPESDPIAFSASGLPAFGSLTDNGNGTGSMTFGPGFFDAGVFSVTVTAHDGSGSDSDVFVLTVNNINRQPSISSITNQTVDENSSLSLSLSTSDLDTDDSLTFSASGLPVFGSLTDNGDGTGTIHFNPAIGNAGSYGITVTVDDGNLANSIDITSFTLTVNSVGGTGVVYYNDFSSGVPADDFTGATADFAIGGGELSAVIPNVWKDIDLKDSYFPDGTDNYKVVSKMRRGTGSGWNGCAIRFRDINGSNWYELQVKTAAENDVRLFGKEAGSKITVAQWDTDIDATAYNVFSFVVSGTSVSTYLGNSLLGTGTISLSGGGLSLRQRKNEAWWDYFRVVEFGAPDYLENFDDALAQDWSNTTDFQTVDVGGGDYAFKQVSSSYAFSTYNTQVSIDANYSVAIDGRTVGMRTKSFESPTMVIKHKDSSNWIIAYVDQNINTGVCNIRLKKKIAGVVTETSIATSITSLTSVESWHTLEAQVNGNSLNFWVNGVQEVASYLELDLNAAAFDGTTTCGVRSATSSVSLEYDNVKIYDEYQ